MTETDDATTLLAIYAHPDDETFGTGGTLARISAEGRRVVLVCATRGEAGEISKPELATPETLGAVREAELRCAVEALGIAEVIFLGYRDSGMAGTAENDDPRAFCQQRTDVVVRQLVEIIRRERPGAIVTFDPSGGYGHPDHIAIHHHATAAISAAGAVTFAPDLGAPWRTPRTWWMVITRDAISAMRDAMDEAGMDTTWTDDLIESQAGWPDDDVDLLVDVSRYGEHKRRAFECHATQFGEDNMFRRASDALQDLLLSREAFVLAAENRERGGPLTSLFQDQ